MEIFCHDPVTRESDICSPSHQLHALTILLLLLLLQTVITVWRKCFVEEIMLVHSYGTLHWLSTLNQTADCDFLSSPKTQDGQQSVPSLVHMHSEHYLYFLRKKISVCVSQ